MITLVSSQKTLRRGGLLEVDVYASGVADLRGYQVAVEAIGGRRGRLELDSIFVDTEDRDYVFQGFDPLQGIDQANGRILSVLIDGGVDGRRAAYLATFVFRASRDAYGAFSIRGRLDEDTVLLDSTGSEIEALTLSETRVSVR